MISTKGRYALRVMIDLAEQRTDDFVPLTTIASRQEISLKYLEIILKIFVQKKLLKGRRGKGGGYKLTRDPKDYTVKEILELTDGPLATFPCIEPDSDECPRRSTCRTYSMWVRFNELVRSFFENISLAELMREGSESLIDLAGNAKQAPCVVRTTIDEEK